MQDDTLRVKFWGVRGSLPVSGEQFLHYGGNTPCIEIRCGKEVLIFDAGSGLREAGLSLMSEGVSEFDVFFTHTHYDHIIGLPYFKPIYRCSSAVRFWSGHLHGKMSTAEMINEFMSQGQPARCTTTTPLVLGVSLALMVSAVMFWLSRSTSAKMATPPAIGTVEAEAMKLRGVTMTSSPGSNPSAKSARSSATVPLARATA